MVNDVVALVQLLNVVVGCSHCRGGDEICDDVVTSAAENETFCGYYCERVANETATGRETMTGTC